MEDSRKNENIESIVANNIKNLRQQGNLTPEGLAAALDISISYVLMLERGASNISQKLATKISNFFDIQVAQLYSSKEIKLKSTDKIISIAKFNKLNENNPEFFSNRRKEYSAAAFIRDVILKDEFIFNFHSVAEIQEYSLQKYKRSLSSQELSRELRRLFIKEKLEREDKFKNGSVYLYRMKPYLKSNF